MLRRPRKIEEEWIWIKRKR